MRYLVDFPSEVTSCYLCPLNYDTMECRAFAPGADMPADVEVALADHRAAARPSSCPLVPAGGPAMTEACASPSGAQERVCLTCRHFDSCWEDGDRPPRTGDCLLNPPVWVGPYQDWDQTVDVPSNSAYWSYPHVGAHATCGSWEPVEGGRDADA